MKIRHVVGALAMAALTGSVVWALKRNEDESREPEVFPPEGSNGTLPAAEVVIRKPRRLPRAAAAAPRLPRRRSHARRKSA